MQKSLGHIRRIVTTSCLWLMLCLAGNAQQPAFYKFGEEVFKGVQIYDVIQDAKLNYWFGTSEGIYLWDYHSFEKIAADKARSISVFNFVMDGEGVIYCHNLNHQIFRIEGRECRLFHELGEEEGSADMSLAVAGDGNLIAGARKIVVLDKTGKALLRRDAHDHYLGPAFNGPDGTVWFHLSGADSILVYAHGAFSNTQLRWSETRQGVLGVLRFYRMGTTTCAVDLKTKDQYEYNPQKREWKRITESDLLTRTGSVRIYETGEEAWVAGAISGLAMMRQQQAAGEPGIYFSDYFISNVYRDREGNYLLSTFDKGVLVIPDLRIEGALPLYGDDPVTAVYSDPGHGLILGSSKGNLRRYENRTSAAVQEKGTHPIQAVYGSPVSDLVLFDNGYIRALNKRTGVVMDVAALSLKDAAIVSQKEMYLGTNVGIASVTWDGRTAFEVDPSMILPHRIYSLEYNAQNHCLYAATANGFFVIDSTGQAAKILLGKDDIFPVYLHCSGGKIYASTREKGILVVEHAGVTDSIFPTVNGRREMLKKFVIRDGTLIGSSSSGFFQFDLKGKSLKSIHSLYGFPVGRVADFTFEGNDLWVIHSGGLQKIDLNYAELSPRDLAVRLDRIFVNDTLVSPSMQGSFSSDGRKIQFVFSSPTLRNRESIRYHYRLSGYDPDWTLADAGSDEVTYNALAPGTYTFEVKAESRGEYSAIAAYQFTIAYPFYARWWFIALAVTVFLLLVFSIYRRQLLLQRRKSEQLNQLNASRLSAIQSQMNPHFIFNSLNSIQDLILKGDVEHSYSYITTFSNLVRRTLDYSEKDFIDFEQETELLKLYLSLEKLRFRKDLHYEINVADNVEDVRIPPLLVQPFIENALVHGLLHKQGEKRLIISFELADVLICRIEDNGVGREQAKAIRGRQRAEHESFSGKAIRKRLEILGDIYNGQFGYEYEDLTEAGVPSGTRVTLRIPVQHKF